jgi:hypothetical protein
MLQILQRCKLLRLLAVLLLSLGLLGIVGVVIHDRDIAEADTVVSYTTSTLYDGSTGYTTTEASPVRLSAPFAHVQIQGHLVSTGVMTITPQFSLEPVGCTAVTDWFSATETLLYADSDTTPTVAAIGSVANQLVISGTGSVFREVDVGGRCMRVKLETSTVKSYTPTVYMRLINK